MYKTEINKDQITSVIEYKFRKAKDIVYKKPKVNYYLFGLFTDVFEGGFYYAYTCVVRPNLKLNCYVVKGDEVWEKPELIIEKSSGKCENIVFETNEEMENWREKYLKGINLIKI